MAYEKFRLTHRLVGAHCFEAEPFVLADVGVSGGIASHWRVFGDQLRVLGFDPLVNEIQRLEREARGGTDRYFATRLGAPPDADRDPVPADPVASRSDSSLARTSAIRAEAILRHDGRVRYQGGNTDLVFSDDVTTLDDFCRDHDEPRVDFLKVDTDGFDLPVLLGAERTLRESPVLGLLVEAQFQGPVHDRGNTFANIDRLLRGTGFSLFDMHPWPYSRTALPLRFDLDFPAQTRRGQVSWADVLYLRDAANPLYAKQWHMEFSVEQLLKLVAILEIHRLKDCSAELLTVHRARLQPYLRERGVDFEAMLDSITPKLVGRRVSYAEYIAAFEADPTRWYTHPPSRLRLALEKLLPKPRKRR